MPVILLVGANPTKRNMSRFKDAELTAILLSTNLRRHPTARLGHRTRQWYDIPGIPGIREEQLIKRAHALDETQLQFQSCSTYFATSRY